MAVTNLKVTNGTYADVHAPRTYGEGAIADADELVTDTNKYPLGTEYLDITNHVLYQRVAIGGTTAADDYYWIQLVNA